MRRARVGDKSRHMGIVGKVGRRRTRGEGGVVRPGLRDFGGSGGFVYGCFWQVHMEPWSEGMILGQG